MIERAHDYLERSFLPGRTFVSPADFTTRSRAWLAVVNTRVRRALGCAPVERIAADRAAMLTVAPVAPVTGWRSATRLARDHYIRLDSDIRKSVNRTHSDVRFLFGMARRNLLKLR